ncbi:pyridoxamine kinase [Caproiciproducens sp. CPB-2]|uniref:pyridoxamine kinase n=1 Tax=Caproiciproducens sp. CPB-2 TaxID=3030017 RepID=UPI0023DA2425|nr:pyridoxamine kinase [Caproiciproducens sp. CPB-2]MDF1495884.1 pyridoxamine kinase [Caproiciproducens sp. CPB-2]
MNKQKRIAAIHDISGFGKCSLTVALPILSAAGIEVCPVPTAVLSSHTGDLDGFTYRDLTDDMPGFQKQWKQLGLSFEALYSGFLGSYEQISIVSDFFDTFKTENTLVMVDPVMADSGELYRTITPQMAEGMVNLCGKADLIVPNFTEAAFLLGEKYREGPYTRDYVENLLRRLSGLGPRQVVITGVWFSPDLLGAAGYNRNTDAVSYAFSQKIRGRYYGTGDIFASALLSGLLNGMELDIAMQTAVDFTAGCIRRTREAGTDPRYGVHFEAGLLKFMHELGITE